jgi:hypothetical protein
MTLFNASFGLRRSRDGFDGFDGLRASTDPSTAGLDLSSALELTGIVPPHMCLPQTFITDNAGDELLRGLIRPSPVALTITVEGCGADGTRPIDYATVDGGDGSGATRIPIFGLFVREAGFESTRTFKVCLTAEQRTAYFVHLSDARRELEHRTSDPSTIEALALRMFAAAAVQVPTSTPGSRRDVTTSVTHKLCKDNAGAGGCNDVDIIDVDTNSEDNGFDYTYDEYTDDEDKVVAAPSSMGGERIAFVTPTPTTRVVEHDGFGKSVTSPPLCRSDNSGVVQKLTHDLARYVFYGNQEKACAIKLKLDALR